MDRANIFHINRRSVVDFQRDVFDILDARDVAAAAHVILCRRNLERFAADIGVALLDFRDDLGERNAVTEQLIRIKIDLVLLHEPADGRNLGDAFD